MFDPLDDPFPAVGPERAVTVLTLSSSEEDHRNLGAILSRSNWRIYHAWNCKEALDLLRQERIPVVVCERDLADGCWKDVLNHLWNCEDAPMLIVTSRHADDHLWAEVLNLGGYDVLAKPFATEEVVRIISLAWLQWKQRFRAVAAASSAKVLRATA